MATFVLMIRTIENLVKQVSVNVYPEKNTWEATSDPKSLLFRSQGDLSQTIPNLLALITPSGQPVLHLEGFSPKLANKGDEGSGLLFKIDALEFAIGWEVTEKR